jgi:hypothetical protein
MNRRMPSDEQLARILRDHLPDGAMPELDRRVMAMVAATPQQRRMPIVIRPLARTEPGSRRVALVLVAALLVLAVVATAAFVGAFRESPLPRQEFPWNLSRQFEDWPGPLRVETDTGAADYRPVFLNDPSDDPVPALPEIDLLGLEVRTCMWGNDRAACVFFSPAAHASPMPSPEERWLAYGIVVDDDGDGVADYRYGIDNAGPAKFHRVWEGDLAVGTSSIPRFDRMWRTDLETGETKSYVDTLEDPLVMDGVFPESDEFGNNGHIFAVPTGPWFRFYVWSAAIVDGQIVASDFHPNDGWVLFGEPVTPAR